MKYAAIVLRNIKTPTSSVEYAPVADALLSGGVPLGELALLPYDDASAVMGALARLTGECEGVFVICDRVLLPAAREAVSQVCKAPCTGTLLETEHCLVAVLPAGEQGRELALGTVLFAVNKKRGRFYSSVVLRTVSAPAETVLAAVTEAQELAEGKLAIHTSERYGVGRIEIVYDDLTPKVIADEVVRVLATALEKYVYAMEDVEISARLFEALKLHRLKISAAESFTGGGVAAAIVKNAGASTVFYEGIVAYDGEAKQTRLGVGEYTLKNKGAVSSETAYEMAAGLLKDGKCDIAVATTGLAGPKSDLSGKPVGLCYFAVGTRERVRVFEFRLEGDREEITQKAVNLALFLTYKEIN